MSSTSSRAATPSRPATGCDQGKLRRLDLMTATSTTPGFGADHLTRDPIPLPQGRRLHRGRGPPGRSRRNRLPRTRPQGPRVVTRPKLLAGGRGTRGRQPPSPATEPRRRSLHRWGTQPASRDPQPVTDTEDPTPRLPRRTRHYSDTLPAPSYRGIPLRCSSPHRAGAARARSRSGPDVIFQGATPRYQSTDKITESASHARGSLDVYVGALWAGP